MIAPYEVRGSALAVLLPRECPSGKGCRVGIHHYRKRETGFSPLAVAECRTHQIHFTLYPPGQVPYGRVSVVALSPDGGAQALEEVELEAVEAAVEPGGNRPERPVSGERRSPEEPPLPAPATKSKPPSSLLPRRERRRRKARAFFLGTVFESALDAVAGRLWPVEGALRSFPGVFSTQRRRTREAAQLLGVEPGLHDALRGELCEALGLDGLLQAEASKVARAASSALQQRAHAVEHILLALRPTKRLAQGLAVAGHLVGRWGLPFSCDRWTRRLRPLAASFRHATQRQTPPARGDPRK